MVNDSAKDVARRAFVVALRRALHHLYNAVELRKNELLPLFGLSGPAGVVALRQTLEDAINALKPRPGISCQSDAWRTYRVLYHRYVEQFDQPSVAANLGISVRQLRRQEQIALHTLADWLIERHHLKFDAAFGCSKGVAPDDAQIPAVERDVEINQELRWAEQFFPSQLLTVDEIVHSALQTVTPLMSSVGVTVRCEIPSGLPLVLAPAISVRQALINLLIVATRAATTGLVQISSGCTDSQVWVNVAPLGDHDAEALALAGRLMTISGGILETCGESSTAQQSVRIRLPVAGQLPVLAIDDNADSLRLLERCLTNSRYRLIGVRESSQALALAQHVQPCAIMLDVMLPDVDGWELLGRLRVHPDTCHIPIIVCTILPQEDLALTLGAAGFMRKPISRERVLSALDQQVRPEERAAD